MKETLLSLSPPGMHISCLYTCPLSCAKSTHPPSLTSNIEPKCSFDAGETPFTCSSNILCDLEQRTAAIPVRGEVSIHSETDRPPNGRFSDKVSTVVAKMRVASWRLALSTLHGEMYNHYNLIRAHQNMIAAFSLFNRYLATCEEFQQMIFRRIGNKTYWGISSTLSALLGNPAPTSRHRNALARLPP
jgi:hypothetical protein